MSARVALWVSCRSTAIRPTTVAPLLRSVAASNSPHRLSALTLISVAYWISSVHHTDSIRTMNTATWSVQDGLQTPEDCREFIRAALEEAADDPAFMAVVLAEVKQAAQRQGEQTQPDSPR